MFFLQMYFVSCVLFEFFYLPFISSHPTFAFLSTSRLPPYVTWSSPSTKNHLSYFLIFPIIFCIEKYHVVIQEYSSSTEIRYHITEIRLLIIRYHITEIHFHFLTITFAYPYTKTHYYQDSPPFTFDFSILFAISRFYFRFLERYLFAKIPLAINNYPSTRTAVQTASAPPISPPAGQSQNANWPTNTTTTRHLDIELQLPRTSELGKERTNKLHFNY